MRIPVINPPTDDLEQALLTSPMTASASPVTLPVSNSNMFSSTNCRVLIGDMGTETAEIQTVTGVPGNNSVTVGALNFDHDSNTPIFVLQFDVVNFYKSTTGASGNYGAALATIAVDVDNADLETFYDDTSGDDTDYYKVSFFHSLLNIESDLSDAIPGSGHKKKSVGYVVNSLLRELAVNDADKTLSRQDIYDWLDEVNDDLETRTERPYTFLKRRLAISRVANANTLDYPVDSSGDQLMWKFDYMDYNFQDSTTNPVTNQTYTLRVIPIQEYRQKYQDENISSANVSNRAKTMALDDSVKKFRYHPASSSSGSAVFYLHYWKYFDRFSGDSQVFETPGVKIYKDYVRGKFYRQLAKRDNSYLPTSDRYMNDYNLEVSKLFRANRKDTGSPRSFGMRQGRTFKGSRKY